MYSSSNINKTNMSASGQRPPYMPLTNDYASNSGQNYAASNQSHVSTTVKYYASPSSASRQNYATTPGQSYPQYTTIPSESYTQPNQAYSATSAQSYAPSNEAYSTTSSQNYGSSSQVYTSASAQNYGSSNLTYSTVSGQNYAPSKQEYSAISGQSYSPSSQAHSPMSAQNYGSSNLTYSSVSGQNYARSEQVYSATSGQSYSPSSQAYTSTSAQNYGSPTSTHSSVSSQNYAPSKQVYSTISDQSYSPSNQTYSVTSGQNYGSSNQASATSGQYYEPSNQKAFQTPSKAYALSSKTYAPPSAQSYVPPSYEHTSTTGAVRSYIPPKENKPAPKIGASLSGYAQNKPASTIGPIPPPPTATLKTNQPGSKSALGELHEVAVQRGEKLEWSQESECGPAHSKLFSMKVTMGSYEAVGSGRSKKLAKQLAAQSLLEQLQENQATQFAHNTKEYGPQLPDTSQNKQDTTHSSQTAPVTDSQHDNPISKLQQVAKKHKLGDPEYEVVCEDGPLALQKFDIKVKVNNLESSGLGRSKKAAKRNAAQAMLDQLSRTNTAIEPPQKRIMFVRASDAT